MGCFFKRTRDIVEKKIQLLDVLHLMTGQPAQFALEHRDKKKKPYAKNQSP